ncbi:MAG: hypothetical protein QXN87_04840 [Candidatus Bathyarchaeia archaeon]
MIRVKVDERLERKFRELAKQKFGSGKGALSRAAEEAMLLWMATAEEGKIAFKENPVEAIDSLLSDVEIDALELQHKIRDLWLVKKNARGFYTSSRMEKQMAL